MNATPEPPVRHHTRVWLVALLLAFIAGFVLAWWLLHQHFFAKPLCPPGAPSDSAQAGGGAMRGAGAPGAGSPAKLGAGDGAGAGNIPASAGTAPEAQGTPSGGGSAKGDLAGGALGGGSSVGNNPGSGSGKPGDGGLGIDDGGGKGKPPGEGGSMPSPSASTPSAMGTPSPATTTAGTSQLGEPDADADAAKEKPDGKMLAAADYRYDKSGLPHYPNATKVASGTDAAVAAAVAGSNAKNFSITEVLTNDTPDAVADWYEKNVPPGWQRVSMPSAEAMAQATAQSKTAQPGESPVDVLLKQMVVAPQIERSTPGIDAARAVGFTVFQPADPNTDHRMILVIKDSKSGKTGILLMKKADAPGAQP